MRIESLKNRTEPKGREGRTAWRLDTKGAVWQLFTRCRLHLQSPPLEYQVALSNYTPLPMMGTLALVWSSESHSTCSTQEHEHHGAHTICIKVQL